MPPDAAPLGEAYEDVRAHLASADNLGRSGDARDLYTHLDRLADGVKQTFPESYCRSGCSSCCHYPVGLFTITMTEWNVIRRHIETEWSEDERQDFIQRYQATFTGFWRVLITFLQESMASLMIATPLFQRKRIACPFLKDNKCTVYAARPYQCRTFGYFSARVWPFKQPKVYACDMQGELLLKLLARSGPQVQLPVMNPIVRRIRELCKGPRMALPLWVAAWIESRARAGELGK